VEHRLDAKKSKKSGTSRKDPIDIEDDLKLARLPPAKLVVNSGTA